jgi:hypothetical protein
VLRSVYSVPWCCGDGMNYSFAFESDDTTCFTKVLGCLGYYF